MKNNIVLPEGIDSKPFFNAIKSNLNANLNEYLISVLSNVLAIDYASRVKDKVILEEHIKLCIKRLTLYLKHTIVIEKSFSTVISLFTVAIAAKKIDDNVKTDLRDQELLIDNIISTHFSNLSSEDQHKLKDVLCIIISGFGAKNIMNFISSDPKLFYSIVFAAYKQKIKAIEVIELARMHISTIMIHDKSISKIKSSDNKLENTFLNKITATKEKRTHIKNVVKSILDTEASKLISAHISKKYTELQISFSRKESMINTFPKITKQLQSSKATFRKREESKNNYLEKSRKK